jgi:hypothetical protein
MTKQVAVQEQAGLKPWVSYTIIGVAVLVSVVTAYRLWTRGNQDPIAMMCVTEGCKYTTSVAPRPGDPSILTCPKCGKESVTPAIYCPKCGTPTVWNESRGLPGPTKCKKCGQEMRHGG